MTLRTGITAILSRHCLECHDASTHKGGLDLSQRELALRGGDGGAVVISGKSSDGPLWQRVVADEMPHDRTPLSADEKSTLKKWIDEGAEWRSAVIDPANYIHGNSSQAVFVQRLTVSEYVESVRTLLGVDVAQQASGRNLNPSRNRNRRLTPLVECVVKELDTRDFP